MVAGVMSPCKDAYQSPKSFSLQCKRLLQKQLWMLDVEKTLDYPGRLSIIRVMTSGTLEGQSQRRRYEGRHRGQ